MMAFCTLHRRNVPHKQSARRILRCLTEFLLLPDREDTTGRMAQRTIQPVDSSWPSADAIFQVPGDVSYVAHPVCVTNPCLYFC